MGFLDKLFGRDSKSEQDSKPATDLILEDPTTNGTTFGNFRGERVLFRSEYSPNGKWQCLYSQSGSTDGSPVVLVNTEGEIQYAIGIGQAENVAVSNTGYIAVTETGKTDGTDLRGTLHVVNSEGKSVLEHEFDAINFNCAITDDGRYASTATNNPDRSVYIFDTKSGEVVTEFETPNLNGPVQEFDRLDGEPVLYLLEQDTRYRAIDLKANTVWKSADLEEQEHLDELLERSTEEDLAEALEILEGAYELADNENEQKPIALRLADTHWKLANEIRKEEGDTDGWWANLNQSKLYYMENLSWHDGKKGVAKVQRKQAKYHLKEGNEEMALELWENIADLEDEYGVQLLTDADKEKIEELS